MKKPAVQYETCASCEGSGKIPGASTGDVLKREREGRGVTRPALAPHFVDENGEPYSLSYIFDLEKDARPWSQWKVTSYRAAIEAAVAARLEAEQTVEA